MDKRIGAAVGLFLLLEVSNAFQLYLPPVAEAETLSSAELKHGVKQVAAWVGSIAFLAGVLTRNPFPLVLPAVGIGVLYAQYLSHRAKFADTTTEEEA